MMERHGRVSQSFKETFLMQLLSPSGCISMNCTCCLLLPTRSIFSYMLVLVASLGWGVTRPYLDQPTILKAGGPVTPHALCILKVLCSSNSYCTVVLQVQALSCFYIVLDFVRESALSFRCLQQKRGFYLKMTVVMKPTYTVFAFALCC